MRRALLQLFGATIAPADRSGPLMMVIVSRWHYVDGSLMAKFSHSLRRGVGGLSADIRCYWCGHVSSAQGFDDIILNMSRMIDSIGNLTELRERDELEATLASVMFDLVGPRGLIVWRIVKILGVHRLRRSISFSVGQPGSVLSMHDDVEQLPLLTDFKALHACWSTRSQLTTKSDDGNTYRYIYPIGSELDVVALIDIETQERLREYQQRLVAGLVRIYRNHVRVLDEGDLDPLTGLLNRKRFDELFKRQINAQNNAVKELASYGMVGNRRPPNLHQSAWLAVADIDHFKSVNDNYGHDYGDEVLLLIARYLTSVLRETDCVFRFGGEEFVLLLSPTEPRYAAQVMERCRVGIEGIKVPRVGHVTVSIGFTRVSSSDTGAEAFGRADKALYVAKNNGRNQVMWHEKLIEDGTIERVAPVEAFVELF